MAPYIHSKREGSHIIDLTKTVVALELALEFLTKTAAEGKQVLLVSTKRQAKGPVKEVAEATGMPYVTERWLGGMLTNQNTIGARIRRLKDLESRMATGELAAKYSKLEVQRMAEEIEGMNQLYAGIKDMDGRPGAVFVVDVITDDIPVREARKLNIPVVALIDTNADPSIADYPIPRNDDATKTIQLVMAYIQDAILAGKAKVKAPAKTAAEPEAKVKGKPALKEEKPAETTEPAVAPVRGIG
jgi:small subunit ribosomal protein S2